MRTPYLLLPALAFVALCLAASAHATNPVSLAEANALAEPLGADGILLDFRLQELRLAPDATAKHPGQAKAVETANREMKAFVLAENLDLYRRMPELFTVSARAGARHAEARFNMEEVRLDRADSHILAVSAFCAVRSGSRPDLSGYAAVYDMAAGRRLAFADIVADKRRFTDALVAEARTQDEHLPESVRDLIVKNPFLPKPGVEHLPLSLTDREAIVLFPLMANMLKEVRIPFAKHPGVFTALVQQGHAERTKTNESSPGDRIK
ncbi:MAG: hypothetical protein II132_05095 [Desulfovibrio sp.]|nr:hypothetical protein [Desulfovibrio sp.]